jgi:hypothetical protein
MGRRDARDLAIALISSYQGIALLTNTFRDPELMSREGGDSSAGSTHWNGSTQRFTVARALV